MTENERYTTKTDRRPTVTENPHGKPVLTVSGYFFKQGATDTAADKMMSVEAEVVCRHTPPFSA